MGIFDKLFGKKDLIHATQNGDTETVEMLLTKGADVNAKNKDGETALMLAAKRGYMKIVEMLLTQGADVNAKNKYDKYGMTALMLAALEGHIGIVEMLLTKGANVDDRSGEGDNTALMLAAQEGHIRIVEMLLTKGADVNAKNVRGVTALMLAALGGHVEIVEMLLTKGADINAKCNEGSTALISAECGKDKNRSNEIVRLLEYPRKHKEEQDRYLKELIFLGDNSIELFEKMPEHLKTAEEYLNQAEIEFSEGAFAPFWDAIEKTAFMLGRFDEGVQTIENNSSKYIDLIPKYEGVPPGFPLSRKSVEKLIISTSTAKRMNEIVRAAQRNFQFATIYEQRKTNQILIAGFTNLAQALDRMTWKITTSIDNLNSSVNSLNNTTKNIHSRLDNIADANIKQHSEIIKLESARKEREQRALKMLDNIQHHRKPSWWRDI